MTHRDTALHSNVVASASGLLARLARESDAAVTDCDAEATLRAQTLRENAEQAARTQRQDALSARARQHAQESRAARDLAQQRVVAETLEARTAAIEQVIAAAMAQSDLLSSHAELAERVQADIRLALRFLPDGGVNVRCPPSFAAIAQTAASAIDAARLSVVVDTTLPFGIVVESGDGAVMVDATITRKLASDRPRLAIRIAQLLDQSFA